MLEHFYQEVGRQAIVRPDLTIGQVCFNVCEAKWPDFAALVRDGGGGLNYLYPFRFNRQGIASEFTDALSVWLSAHVGN